MKTLKRLLAIVICVAMMMQLPVISYAATTYYEATKDAKVYTKPYKDSTHKYTVDKGDIVKVVSSTVNSYDNLWYKLDDGYYTYSGNYKKHTNHVGIMCGMPSTTYEKNNASSHIKVYYSGDELCACGYAVSKGTTSRTNESHSFNSNNKCTKCGYQKTHTHEAIMCGNPSTTYEKNNSSSHVKVYYSGDELCSCGYVVKKGTTSRTNESHSFNSNDTCTKCNYKKVHEHKAVMCGAPSTTYEKNNASSHVKVYYSGDELCSCGYVVKKGSTTRTGESHSFDSNNKCTKCGYQKTHTHEAIMCGNPSTTYEKNNASSHVKVYYSGDELCSCGYVVKKGTTTRNNESHSFNSNDKCTKCGYKREPTTHSHVAVKCGMPSTTYEKNNSSYHIVVYYSGDELCSCGYVVSKGTTTRNNEYHSFGSNDRCTKCDYKKEPSTHTHKSSMCGMPSTAYEKNNSSSHIKIYYSGDELCSCGYVVAIGSTSITEEAHSFNSNGKCTKCDYQKETTTHSHVAVKCGMGSTTYEKGDTSSHIVISYSGDELCSCGYVVSKGNTSKSTEKHSFDSNDRCTKCDYKKNSPAPSTVHIHEGVKCGMPTTTYDPKNETSHIVNHYSGDELCSCGYVVKNGVYTSSIEEHTYDSNLICTKCKYDNNKIISESEIDNPNYITVKDNVPVRTFCKKSASVAYKIEKKGTNVVVNKLVVNQVGHIWAKTSDGYYIYIENLLESTNNESTLPIYPAYKQCQSIKFEKGKLVHSYVTSNNEKDTHLLIKHYEKVCLVCGKTVYQKDSHTYNANNMHIYIIESERIPHTFDKNNTCLQCGYNYEEYVANEADLDKLSAILAALGLVPVVGNVADALDLALNIARGNFTDAAISAMAIAPFVGQIAGSAKAAKSIKSVQDTIDAIDDLNALNKASKALNKGQDAVSLIRNAENTDEILSVVKLSENSADAARLGKRSTRDILLESADNQSLKNTINELYRPGASTFDGGTADARRLELITGRPVGETFHDIKVSERINNLNNILRRQNLSPSDRLLAEALRKDLQKTLEYIPKTR